MTRQAAFIIFLVALALRMIYLAAVYDGADSLRAPDSNAYEQAARALAESGELARTGPDGSRQVFTERAPGYVGYLALVRLAVGGGTLGPAVGQAVLDALTCVLVGWLAGFLNRRIALAAGILAAINANLIVHAGQILSDSLFLLPFTGGMVATLAYAARPGRLSAGAAGLLFALAWLIRPVILFFAPILLGALVIAAWRHRLGFGAAAGHAALAALVMALAVGPLYYTNHRDFGHLALTSQVGTHALNWVVPLVREYAYGTPPAETRAEMNRRLEARLAAQGRSELPDNPFAASAQMQAVAREALLESGPLAMAKAWGAGFAINLLTPALIAAPPVRAMKRPSFFETPGANPANKVWNYLHANPGFTFVILPALVLTGLCRLLSAGALLQTGRRLATGPVVFLLAAALYFAAVTGPVTGVKYRLPLEPALDVLLAAALLWIADVWWRRGNRRAPVAGMPVEVMMDAPGPNGPPLPAEAASEPLRPVPLGRPRDGGQS